MGTDRGFTRRQRRGRGDFSEGGPLRPVFDDFGGRSAKPDYKTAALCKQVRRVVSLALAGECGDPVLQELLVEDVLPAPNAGRLLVRVMLAAREGGPGVIDVLQRLAAVEGMLRAVVAEAIARKRAPELAFDVVPCGIGVPPMSPEEGPHELVSPAPSADIPANEAGEVPHE